MAGAPPSSLVQVPVHPTPAEEGPGEEGSKKIYTAPAPEDGSEEDAETFPPQAGGDESIVEESPDDSAHRCLDVLNTPLAPSPRGHQGVEAPKKKWTSWADEVDEVMLAVVIPLKPSAERPAAERLPACFSVWCDGPTWIGVLMIGGLPGIHLWSKAPEHGWTIDQIDRQDCPTAGDRQHCTDFTHPQAPKWQGEDVARWLLGELRHLGLSNMTKIKVVMPGRMYSTALVAFKDIEDAHRAAETLVTCPPPPGVTGLDKDKVGFRSPAGTICKLVKVTGAEDFARRTRSRGAAPCIDPQNDPDI
eukprot:TRINITY_DN1032_c0_g2_i2.p1 TRINITY_DN1032_c0_g2~~TRINITY_DN1032_c0_g2_i2.p1  ORF type:complete len:304 (+),score=45.99 TRINITY_DN1032_c0_g2_i2:114-1025(+)